MPTLIDGRRWQRGRERGRERVSWAKLGSGHLCNPVTAVFLVRSRLRRTVDRVMLPSSSRRCHFRPLTAFQRGEAQMGGRAERLRGSQPSSVSVQLPTLRTVDRHQRQLSASTPSHYTRTVLPLLPSSSTPPLPPPLCSPSLSSPSTSPPPSPPSLHGVTLYALPSLNILRHINPTSPFSLLPTDPSPHPPHASPLITSTSPLSQPASPLRPVLTPPFTLACPPLPPCL